jgi:hypothetical protein
MDWTDLPRLETTSRRLENTYIGNNILAINAGYGIFIYRNAIKKDECKNIIDSLEKEISSNIPNIKWSGAMINDEKDNNEVRNCLDFKFKKENLGAGIPFNQALYDIHDSVEKSLDECLRHYESLWHLKMHYKEAFNFVKYLPGKYFKIHADHGPYYACTVSAVVYLNDDYEGGELNFIRQELTIKPEAGDIILCPSNFVYEHASLEIKSGVKHCVVIMTDYNDLHHQPDSYDYSKITVGRY